MAGGARLELVVLLRYCVLVWRLASGRGGDVLSLLVPAFCCFDQGLSILGFAWDERVGLGGSLLVVCIPVAVISFSGYRASRLLLGVRLWVWASVILGEFCFAMCWGLHLVAVTFLGAKLLYAGVLFVAVFFSGCVMMRGGWVVTCVGLKISMHAVGVECCELPVTLFLFCLSVCPNVCFSFSRFRQPYRDDCPWGVLFRWSFVVCSFGLPGM